MGRGSRQQASALDISAVLNPSLRPRAVTPTASAPKPKPNGRDFRCPSCSSSFETIGDCMHHQRIMHPGSGSRFSISA
jgi:hypothetical protein